MNTGTPNYFIFDTETGGFSPSKNPICEVAGLLIDGTTLEVLMEYESIIKPYNPNHIYSPEAEKVHGLTQEFLTQKGEELEVVVAELIEIFKFANEGKKKSGKLVLVGHNVNFDIGFLDALFTEAGQDLAKYVKSDRIRNQFSYPYGLDTIDLCHARWGDQNMSSFKLSDCCVKGEIEIADAHRAMNDVLPTYDLFKQAVLGMRNSGNIEKTENKRKFKF